MGKVVCMVYYIQLSIIYLTISSKSMKVEVTIIKNIYICTCILAQKNISGTRF
jgi:hypothetical protein